MEKKQVCFVLGWVNDPSLLHSVLSRSPTPKILFWSGSGIGCCEVAILSPDCLSFSFSFILSFFFLSERCCIQANGEKQDGGRKANESVAMAPSSEGPL